MGYCGGPTTQAPGATQDIIYSVVCTVIGGAVVADATVWRPYRNRYLAPYFNGIYYGRNIWAGDDGRVSATFPLTDVDGSVYFEDAGLWSVFADGGDPAYNALKFQEATANKFEITWGVAPTLTPVRDDAQLSSIVVSGAARSVNCSVDPLFPTRGVLSYSIVTNGSAYEIRWWKNNLLVAFGSRIGNGSVVCQAVNGSGLQVTCSITYSADIAPGIATLELRWPQSYQVHFSTSVLTFPRVPEDTVTDKGGSAPFSYLTPMQNSGNVHYAIVPVDDENNPYASPAEASDSPVAILNPPAPPSALVASGTAAALTVAWTIGETGCTYRCYRGRVNTPVNFGSLSTPAPIETAVDATSQVLAAITDYASIDQSMSFATLAAAWDAAVAAILSAFATGEAGFLAAIDTLGAALDTAIDAFRADIALNISDFKTLTSGIILGLTLVAERYGSGDASGWDLVSADYQAGETILPLTGGTGDFDVGALVTISSIVYVVAAWDGATLALSQGLDSDLVHTSTYSAVVTPMSTSDWQSAVGLAFANALTSLGELLDHTPGRYTGSMGTPPNMPAAPLALLDVVTPFVIAGKVRICVRSKKSGIEDQTNQEIEVEFDDSGNLITPRPGKATINPPLVFSAPLVGTVVAGVIDDASNAPADFVNLYVTPHGTPFDFTSPAASVAISAAVMGYNQVSLAYTFSTAGDYDLAVGGAPAARARSADWDTWTEYIANDSPNAALNVSSQVIRG